MPRGPRGCGSDQIVSGRAARLDRRDITIAVSQRRCYRWVSFHTACHALSSLSAWMQPVWNYFRMVPRAKSQCALFAVRTTATRGSETLRVDLPRTSAATTPRRRWSRMNPPIPEDSSASFVWRLRSLLLLGFGALVVLAVLFLGSSRASALGVSTPTTSSLTGAVTTVSNTAGSDATKALAGAAAATPKATTTPKSTTTLPAAATSPSPPVVSAPPSSALAKPPSPTSSSPTSSSSSSTGTPAGTASATEPVTGAVTKATQSVSAATQPVTGAVTKATQSVSAAAQPVTGAVTKATQSVSAAAQPVTGAVTKTVQPVIAGATETTRPVIAAVQPRHRRSCRGHPAGRRGHPAGRRGRATRNRRRH